MKTAKHLAGLLAIGLGALTSGCSTPNGASGGGGPGGTGPGGSGTTSDSGGASAGSLPCDVQQVLANRCDSCHANPPLFGAPMPLLTYADLHAPTPSSTSVPVYASVETRTHDAGRPMPPPPNALLTAAEQATLDAWIASGAPAGDGSSCSTSTGGSDASAGGGDDASVPDDCVFDTHLAPAAPYAMVGQEQYACYGFDIPTAGKRHVTQIKVHLDNSKIVHHVLLLESPTLTSNTAVACDPAPTLGSPMMYAWAPGGNPLIVPPEAGFPQDQTTHYLVQIHYNNAANAPNPVDSTGFDLCTTGNLRKYDADVVAFGTELISIPPRGTSTSTTCLTVPAALNGTTFFSAFPHMHKLGTAISTTLLTDGGAPIDMGTIAHWDFSNQPWLTIGATLSTGDIVRASCSWSNPGDTTVNFGQTTEDEMCFSFSAYYPKAATYGWASPAVASVPCQ